MHKNTFMELKLTAKWITPRTLQQISIFLNASCFHLPGGDSFSKFSNYLQVGHCTHQPQAQQTGVNDGNAKKS